VLVRLKEGTVLRYRCHTGHSYSLQALLADVNEEIDVTLWSAVRAIEERILLLSEKKECMQASDKEAAILAIKEAREAEKQVKIIRKMLLSTEMLGHTPKR
jgi:two-component system chemotaxis response regulator CheB